MCAHQSVPYFVGLILALDVPQYRSNGAIIFELVIEIVPVCLFIGGETMYLVWNLRRVMKEADIASQTDEDRPCPPPPSGELCSCGIAVAWTGADLQAGYEQPALPRLGGDYRDGASRLFVL